MIASIVLLITAFAIWAKRQVLETDTWTETSAELLENEAIRDALADFLVLGSTTTSTSRPRSPRPCPSGRSRSPPWSPARSTRSPARWPARPRGEGPSAVEEANRPPTSSCWESSRTTATWSRPPAATSPSISSRSSARSPRTSASARAWSRSSQRTAQLQVADSDEPDKVQTGLDVFKAVAWFLVILALVLYVLAVYLAGDRRRETLRAVGIGFIVVGAAVLLGHRAAGNAVVGALSETASADDAVAATWEIGTTLLRPRSATG